MVKTISIPLILFASLYGSKAYGDQGYEDYLKDIGIEEKANAVYKKKYKRSVLSEKMPIRHQQNHRKGLRPGGEVGTG